MQMQDLRDDNRLTSWIAAEVVLHFKSKLSFYPEENKTKLHKIIYLIADKYNIPITRGWYQFGPFVYNNDVLNINYKDNINKWSDEKYNIEEIRTSIKQYGFDVDEISSSIGNLTNKLIDKSADEFTYIIYNNYAPKEYKNIYLQKYSLTGSRTNIHNILNYYVPKLKYIITESPSDYINKILGDVDLFQDTAFNTFDDPELELITLHFFDAFRDLLLKIEFMLKTSSLTPDMISSIKLGQSGFIEAVWTPYAANIMKNTATGINKENARKMGYRARRTALNKSSDVISSFDSTRRDLGLVLTYQDIKELNKYMRDHELDKNLWKLVKILSGVDNDK
jgi:hypothetical protein